MNNQNTRYKKSDLNTFALALFKAYELGLLANESPHIQELIRIHKTLEHNFIMPLWLKYRDLAAAVYREHSLKSGSKS